MSKDLNRLSAEAIMGYTEYFESPGGLCCCKNEKGKWITWSPITDMNQCMMVVGAKLIKDGWGFSIEYTKVFQELKVEIYKDSDPDTLEAMQEDANHYVCEHYKDISDLNRAFITAALEAVGAWEE